MEHTIVPCFEVTLVYADATTWFAGAFPSLEAANKWVEEEKTRPYWQSTTTVQIVDKSA